MAPPPFIFAYDHPHRIVDQDFGLTLSSDDLLKAVVEPLLSRDYCRPWHQQAAATRDPNSTIRTDTDKFQLNLDVQHFATEDITVKTFDGYIVIVAKHEEKEDEHGFISRQFTRRYVLPGGCNPETVESKLSSDGILTVIAPRRTVPKTGLIVPITQTGPVREEFEDQDSQDTADEE